MYWGFHENAMTYISYMFVPHHRFHLHQSCWNAFTSKASCSCNKRLNSPFVILCIVSHNQKIFKQTKAELQIITTNWQKILNAAMYHRYVLSSQNITVYSYAIKEIWRVEKFFEFNFNEYEYRIAFVWIYFHWIWISKLMNCPLAEWRKGCILHFGGVKGSSTTTI